MKTQLTETYLIKREEEPEIRRIAITLMEENSKISDYFNYLKFDKNSTIEILFCEELSNLLTVLITELSEDFFEDEELDELGGLTRDDLFKIKELSLLITSMSKKEKDLFSNTIVELHIQ